jgi:tetratricopeptide (TPR) repeat protein
MRELTRARRVCLALSGIAIAAWILRPQLADSLVLRGDGFLYRAKPLSALRFYERAVAIDPQNEVAVDRYAFVAMTTHAAPAIAHSIRFASAFLRAHPDDAVVRLDRAQAYRASGHFGEALQDFARVGLRRRDPAALAFAGYAAYATGQAATARRYWRAALELQPDLPAALDGLKKTRRQR